MLGKTWRDMSVDERLRLIVRKAVKEALGTDPSDVADEERMRQDDTEQSVDAVSPSEPEKLEPGHYKKEAEDVPDDGAPTRDPDQPAGEPQEPRQGDLIDDDLQADDVSADVIIDKLNVIRSGRSLGDRDVEQRFGTYVSGLSDPEKVALYGYLKSIGQIVAQGVQGGSVKEPDDEPYDVKMKRLKDLEQRRKAGEIGGDEKPKRFITSQPGDPVVRQPSKAKKGRENTSPPIAVGRRNESKRSSNMIND